MTVNQITDTMTIARFEDGSLREIKVSFTLGTANIIDMPINPAIWDIATKPAATAKNNFNAIQIVETVAAYYRIPVTELQGKSRKRETVLARHMAMLFISRKTKLYLKEIGKLFGNRDHTTVISAKAKMKVGVETDDMVSADYHNLCLSLESVPEYKRRLKKIEAFD